MPKLNPGPYKCRVVKWVIAPAGSNNNLFFFLDFNVEGSYKEGEDSTAAASPLPSGSERRVIRRALTANALDWLMGDLKSLGFDGRKLSRLDPQAPDAFNFSGKEFVGYCVHKDRQDDKTNTTKTYED